MRRKAAPIFMRNFRYYHEHAATIEYQSDRICTKIDYLPLLPEPLSVNLKRHSSRIGENRANHHYLPCPGEFWRWRSFRVWLRCSLPLGADDLSAYAPFNGDRRFPDL